MGSTTETSTSRGQAGPQSPEAQRMMRLLGNMTEQFMDSPEARGDFSITPEQRALIGEAQASAGDVARSSMEQNLEAVLRQLEDSNIGRQITGSSLEAVNNALVGQEQLRNINTMEQQQAGQAAQMALNVPFQNAEATNRALLARLVQPAGTVLNYDQMIRQLNAQQFGEVTKPFSAGNALAMGTQLGAAALTGGASAPATAVVS